MGTGTFYPAVTADNGFWSATGEIFIGGWTGVSLGLGKNTTYSNNIWVMFKNLNIPQGASITSAKVQLTARSSTSGATCIAKIYAENSATPTNPTSDDEAIAKSLTTNSALWSPVPAFTDGTVYDSPDISAVLQEIVDLPGWASGNSVLLLIKDFGSSTSALRDISSLEHNSGLEKPALVVTWGETTVVSPPAAELSIVGNPATLRTDFTTVYEWEGDQTQSRGNFTWKSKLVLLPAMTNFTAARVEADFSADQSAYFAAVAERQTIIARNAAKISSGLPTALVSGAPIGMFTLGGDILEAVPTVAAYAGDATLVLKVYADGVLKQTVNVFSAKPFRLLGGYRSKQYAFQLEGNIAVKKLEIATSIGDLVEA